MTRTLTLLCGGLLVGTIAFRGEAVEKRSEVAIPPAPFPSGQLESSLVTERGTYSSFVDQDNSRTVTFEPVGGGEPVVLGSYVAPDYARFSFRLLGAGELIVLQDEMFETYDSEPAYFWRVISADGSIVAEFDSGDEPQATAIAGGWRLERTDSATQASLHGVLCVHPPSISWGKTECVR
jgi:hypothetical protein